MIALLHQRRGVDVPLRSRSSSVNRAPGFAGDRDAGGTAQEFPLGAADLFQNAARLPLRLRRLAKHKERNENARTKDWTGQQVHHFSPEMNAQISQATAAGLVTAAYLLPSLHRRRSPRQAAISRK